MVFQVRHFPATSEKPATGPELAVLLWQRALDPEAGTWSLPGGWLRDDEDLTTSARRQLAEKVDVREVSHLEQLSVFSAPHRIPRPPALSRPPTSAWCRVRRIRSCPTTPPGTRSRTCRRCPSTTA